MIKILASGSAKRKIPFLETFEVSFAGHFYERFMISRIMLTTLCFQDMGHALYWKHFLLLLLSRNYRGSFAEILCGIS